MRVLLILCIFFAAYFLFLPLGFRVQGLLVGRLRLRRYMLRRAPAVEAKKADEPAVAPERKWAIALQRRLVAAAVPLTPREFLVLLGGVGAALLALGFVWGPLPSVAIGAVLYGAVATVLKRLPERRKERMAALLPDALLLVSSSLKSGYSFVQAIDLVAREQLQPLSEEFQHLTQSIKLGEPFDKAMTDFGKRLDIEELTLVVDTVLITRETGGNVTQVIDELLEVMRENERLAEEVKAVSAQGRMSAWVVGMLPLFLFLFLYAISPDYMSALLESAIGIALLVIAAGSQAIGIAIIRKMLRFKIR